MNSHIFKKENHHITFAILWKASGMVVFFNLIVIFTWMQ